MKGAGAGFHADQRHYYPTRCVIKLWSSWPQDAVQAKNTHGFEMRLDKFTEGRLVVAVTRIPLLAQEVAKASIAGKWKGVTRADLLPLSACNLSLSLAGTGLPWLTQPTLLLSVCKGWQWHFWGSWHPARSHLCALLHRL